MENLSLQGRREKLCSLKRDPSQKKRRDKTLCSTPAHYGGESNKNLRERSFFFGLYFMELSGLLVFLPLQE
jgi:hypothetical protein